MIQIAPTRPMIVPLGESGILVRFGGQLDDAANRAALAFARKLAVEPLFGVAEVVPSLVSVLLRYDPLAISFQALAGEIRLRVSGPVADLPARRMGIDVTFGGKAGPDLAEVAALVGMDAAGFVAAHNDAALRVLTTGFAPGFVYCGFHGAKLMVPRRAEVRPMVPAGSVLFAAGQTAIAATDIPTGWHVIGRTEFRNFDPAREPPTQLAAGDLLAFEAV